MFSSGLNPQNGGFNSQEILVQLAKTISVHHLVNLVLSLLIIRIYVLPTEQSMFLVIPLKFLLSMWHIEG